MSCCSSTYWSLKQCWLLTAISSTAYADHPTSISNLTYILNIHYLILLSSRWELSCWCVEFHTKDPKFKSLKPHTISHIIDSTSEIDVQMVLVYINLVTEVFVWMDWFDVIQSIESKLILIVKTWIKIVQNKSEF